MRFAIVSVAVLLGVVGCSKLTPENYAKVSVGMSYSDVTAILGGPATCSETAGFKNCRWGDDTSHVTVRFAGEKVILHSAQNIR